MTTSLMTPVRLARQLAVFISILASALPFVLNLFIRLDSERYIWVITQPGRCGYLGSGPLFIWIAGQSWLIGFAALVSLVLTRRGQPHVFPTAGSLGGVVVVTLEVILAVTQPEFVARLMGCAG